MKANRLEAGDMKLKMFSWGYHGWGNAVEQLIKAVDAVERSRGFKPLWFADVRIRREVRALGFQGNNLEETMKRFRNSGGTTRYRWFKDLGNNSIITRESGVQIHNKKAASDLLDWALEAHKQDRRVVFFCNCWTPAQCHRTEVTELLLAEARRRRLDLVIDEWPGGGPESHPMNVDATEINALRRGRKSLRLGHADRFETIVGLPVGSVVKVRAGDECLYTACDAAKWSVKEGWVLPTLGQWLEPCTTVF